MALALLVSFAAVAAAHAQTTIPASYAVPAASVDTSKKGFLVRTWKSPGEPNTIAWAEDQLAGLHGANTASAAVFTDTIYGNSYFDETGVFDYWNSGGEGNFPNNATQNTPGLANDGTNDDSYSIEAFTVLDLPAGTIRMGVNSDDGFQVNALAAPDPRDKFGRIMLGQFDGGRGVADTTFDIKIDQAGFYPVRLVYEEGGGDAAVEWFTVGSDGTRHLINDASDPASIKAYRVATSPKAIIATAVPQPGSTTAAPNAAIEVGIVDGTSPIDAATVKLTLDSQPIAATATKSGKTTTIKFTPTALFASGSTHNVVVTYNEGGGVVSSTWSFTVLAYATIPPSAKVTPDTSKPGFVMNIFANSANTQNSNARTESSLVGLLVDSTTGASLPNLADPSVKGVALAAATAPNPANATIKFEIPTVINLNQDAVGQKNGNFQPDDQFPGIPATDGSADGYAAEFLTYVELPAGLITMGVNSDDGFRTTLGFDAITAVSLGEFDGGRGASDTTFSFVVQEAGVYPMRTIYEEGGGDSNIEWFTVKPDGTKVLINDTANGGLKAYRATTGAAKPYVKLVNPGISRRQLNQQPSSVLIVLADGSTPVDANSVALKVDGQAVTTTNVREGSLVKVTYAPTTLQVPTDVHSAEVTFKDSSGASTTDQWQFRNLKNIVVPTAKITEDFNSYPEDTQPTSWVATNFSAHCDDGRDITSQTSESYENWVLVSVDNAPSIDGGVVNVAPGQTFNGQPVTSISSGNILYAESDSRCNTDTKGGSNVGQTQFIVSKPFDMSGFKDGVLMTFSSLYTQNQDSYGGVEYSVDGGKTWLPIVYFLDQPDIVMNGDGTVNAVATFTAPNNDTSHWMVNGVLKGGGAHGYGDGVGAAISQSLADYIAPRINDNQTEGARIEVFRLPEAKGKSDVRLRLSAMGTDSWWFAVDNIAFYDVAGPAVTPPPSNRAYSIGLNFGSNETKGSLAATDMAGVPTVAQANWNNISGANGSTNIISADANGTAQATSVTVFWTSNGTWASTGRGEENNKMTGADLTLMTGYLDTGSATTTSVTISNIPPALVSNGYDVYVYDNGGVGGRGGGYRVLDGSGHVLKDYVRAQSGTNLTGYVQVPVNLPAGQYGVGNYIVFGGIGASTIKIEATTANKLGFGATPRAPINAVQLISPASSPPPPQLAISTPSGGKVTLTFTGTLQSADTVQGPYTDVPGATSPSSVSLTGNAKFFRAAR